MTNKHLLLFKGMYLFEQQEEWKTKAGVRERERSIFHCWFTSPKSATVRPRPAKIKGLALYLGLPQGWQGHNSLDHLLSKACGQGAGSKSGQQGLELMFQCGMPGLQVAT